MFCSIAGFHANWCCRKRKCDGRQPVCTLCEEANNSECEYREEGIENKYAVLPLLYPVEGVMVFCWC